VLLRRAALVATLVAAGGLTSAATAADDVEEAQKITQAEARYQQQPKGQQRCEICLQFNPPSACKIVQGPINPRGWCQFFAARENAR